jgi:hypothetical protein
LFNDEEDEDEKKRFHLEGFVGVDMVVVSSTVQHRLSSVVESAFISDL